MYIIKLDANSIRKIIDSNTADSTVYLNYKNVSDTTTYTSDISKGYLFYKSKFITDNPQIFSRGGG